MTDEQFKLLLERLDKIIELMGAGQKPREITFNLSDKSLLPLLKHDINHVSENSYTEAIGKAIPPIDDPEYRKRLTEIDEW